MSDEGVWKNDRHLGNYNNRIRNANNILAAASIQYDIAKEAKN